MGTVTPASTRRGRPATSEIARRRAERRLAKGRRSDERWTSILSGATTVFARLGYAQATLEDVAAEVGVNRASLYYYVGTKEELLVALLYQPMHQMTANMKAIAQQALPPEEKLRRVLEQYAADMVSTPALNFFLAENLHQVMSGREASDIIENAGVYGEGFTEIIRAGIDDGTFRADLDPKVCTMAILGMFNWTHRWYRPGGSLSLEEIARQFAELALAGLRSPSKAGG
ncbi:MAG: TetR/AcrR family transcriptional regulator [Desertimonas sp.]